MKNTEPDILGRAYEYLLRKFAEGQGQSAGEFYTPKEVGWLMASILDPQPRTTVYDPTCGSAGLLIKARLYFEEHHKDQKALAPHLYGQELNAVTYAMAKMNMFLHDYNDAFFAIGDTLARPGFTAGQSLRQFDYAVASAYRTWETREKLSRVVTLDDVRKADYNLSPSQFVDVGEKVQHRPLSEILADLQTARVAREQADAGLTDVLTKLGLL